MAAIFYFPTVRDYPGSHEYTSLSPVPKGRERTARRGIMTFKRNIFSWIIVSLQMAGLGGSTSATVTTIILAFRKEHEMLKEVEKAKGASSTRRHSLQPLAELCRDKFASGFVPMDPLSPLAFRRVKALLTLECISCLIVTLLDLS